MVLLGTKTDRPWDFGILRLKGKQVTSIVENPKKGKEPSKIKATETYILPKDFFEFYKKLGKEKEDSLIDCLNLIMKKKQAGLVLLKKQAASLKYPWDIFKVAETLFNSDKFGAKVSTSAKIGKNVVVKGRLYIGKNSKIGDNTVINGDCYIGDNCKIGPSNVFRGFVDLEDEVVTGAFCEIKNSLVQQGTHFHSGYVGDSVIGANCRFGAGFITANRRIDRGNINLLIKGKKIDSGLTYFGTVVGNYTKFGIGCGTMPGVMIGSKCVVGPGTIIMENVGDNFKIYTSQNKIIKKARK